MTSGSRPVVGIGEYWAAVRRWWILALVLAGIVGGWLVQKPQARVYEAEASVQVNPLVRQSDEPLIDAGRMVNMESEQEIAGSQRVAELALAIRELAGGSNTMVFDSSQVLDEADTNDVSSAEAAQARDQIEVDIVGGSQILSIRSEAADAESAQRLAQSTAVAYLEFRRNNAGLDPDELRHRLTQRSQTVEAELYDIAEAIGTSGEDNQAIALALGYADVVRRQELSTIGTKLANLETLVVDPGVLLTDAVSPDGPTGLSSLVGPLSGGLVGLIVGVSVALGLSRPNEALRIDEDSWGVVEERERPSRRRR